MADCAGCVRCSAYRLQGHVRVDKQPGCNSLDLPAQRAVVMRVPNSIYTLACVASILLIPPPASADPWPTRPITLICPFGAGGAPDIIARFVAQELSDKLGQKVVVENRTGASGNIGTAAVAKAAPDGYTILLGTPSPLVIN